MNNMTVSQEVLVVGAKSKLGPITKKWVEDYRELSKSQKDLSSKEFAKLNTQYIKDIKAEWGINITLNIFDVNDVIMGVRSEVNFYGHQGSKWYKSEDLRLKPHDGAALKDVLLIDLKNVKVKGKIVDSLGYTVILGHQLLNGIANITVEEVTAAMMHEFGHIFNSFMTLGDYVWLNYYLTDGIEVMLGKKTDRFKLELYNDRWMADNVPEADWKAFIENKNEETAKRVVLQAVRSMQRHHLTDNDITAKRREEQGADLFASRLGYGRALASVLYKVDRYYESPSLARSVWMGEFAKVCVTLLALPLAIVGLMVYDPVAWDAHTMEGRYDPPMQRLVKIRQDIVAQLKRPGPLNPKGLADDLDAIDELIKEYSNRTSIFDHLINFFRPSIRKMNQNTKVEDDIEFLANNDLFVQASKLTNSKV